MNREIRQENLGPQDLSWKVKTLPQGSVLEFSRRDVASPSSSSQIKCQWAVKWAAWQKQKLARYGQPLSKAAALKPQRRRVIWDLTCGLGYDSLWFLFCGQTVVAFERHPAMAALIQANLQAPGLHPWPWEARGGSFTFWARDFLHLTEDERTALPHPDVLYLDPMFGDEGSKRKSLPKKNLQFLPKLVGLDEDAPQLLQAALTWAQAHQVGRVILKRAMRSPTILKPDWEIKAHQVRLEGWSTGPKLD